jgi:hypothetical protein
MTLIFKSYLRRLIRWIYVYLTNQPNKRSQNQLFEDIKGKENTPEDISIIFNTDLRVFSRKTKQEVLRKTLLNNIPFSPSVLNSI